MSGWRALTPKGYRKRMRLIFKSIFMAFFFKGWLDIAPDADANPDNTPFTNEIVFTLAGMTENAEEQKLVAVKYHHVVCKAENGHIFHDQIGHWI